MAKLTSTEKNIRAIKKLIRDSGTIAAYQAFIEVLDEYDDEYSDQIKEAKREKRSVLVIESIEEIRAGWRLQASAVRLASSIDKHV